MPIYEYVCTACGHDLEALQKMSDEPLVYCPQCGEATLKKKVSAASFRLKGTGWYETDFKEKGKKGDKAKAKERKKGDKKDAKAAGRKKSGGGKAKKKGGSRD